MADEWIKMRPSLLTSPKVSAIARLIEKTSDIGKAMSAMCNVTRNGDATSDVTRYVTCDVTRDVMRNVTVTSLLKLWGVANDHTSDGVFSNADLSYIDDIVGVTGFGLALESVGWAEFDPELMEVSLPNFNEYNTSGKNRKTSGAERQQRYREKKRLIEQKNNNESDALGDVTRNVTRDVTGDAREEKNREDINNPLTPFSKGEVWRLPDWIPKPLWSDFESSRKKRKKPMTDRARDMAVAKLQALRDGGHDVTALLEQTILHSWDTFYPLKDQAGSSGGNDAYGGMV